MAFGYDGPPPLLERPPSPLDMPFGQSFGQSFGPSLSTGAAPAHQQWGPPAGGMGGGMGHIPPPAGATYMSGGGHDGFGGGGGGIGRGGGDDWANLSGAENPFHTGESFLLVIFAWLLTTIRLCVRLSECWDEYLWCRWSSEWVADSTIIRLRSSTWHVQLRYISS